MASSAAQSLVQLKRKDVKTEIKTANDRMIHVICPLQNRLVWIAYNGDQYLTLLDNGRFVRKSASTKGYIVSAAVTKSSEILVTMWPESVVKKISSDGKKVQNFSDLKPYITEGICVTDEDEALVCLKSTTQRSDNNAKVVRLSNDGHVIQEICQDRDVTRLFGWPFRIACVPLSGDIIVIDKDRYNVVFLNKTGIRQHLLRYKDKGYVWCPTGVIADKYGRVFFTFLSQYEIQVLSKKDRIEGNLNLQNALTVEKPASIGTDNNGTLWVGTDTGKLVLLS